MERRLPRTKFAESQINWSRSAKQMRPFVRSRTHSLSAPRPCGFRYRFFEDPGDVFLFGRGFRSGDQADYLVRLAFARPLVDQLLAIVQQAFLDDVLFQ